jgi:prepilin-type N-terminal cleavage/methylation domain-containing protein
MLEAGKRSDAGFTLVEMLTVVAISGLVAMIAFPAIRSMSEVGNLLAASSRFAAELGEVRDTAITANRPAQFDRGTSLRAYAINGQTRYLPETLRFDPTSASHIEFFGDGSAAQAQIRLQSERRSALIQVDHASGAIRTAGLVHERRSVAVR